IAFPVTGDFAQNGEQTNENALPWASVSAADYTPTSDLKSIVPLLANLHSARVAKQSEWLAYEADVADVRKLRAEKSISLNEKVRRAEREEQEKTRRERHPKLADASSAKNAPVDAVKLASSHSTRNTWAESQLPRDLAGKAVPPQDVNAASPPIHAHNEDDGLQADERSLKAELAAEKARKAQKDVVLDEAAHILADEIMLIRGDTKLAAAVLPHPQPVKDSVD
ncbi:MAG TPA: carboxy terminal-processing peptidase, partial [Rudaea sp.]|nr:carboxy terminal-processing peptidase [Rudaea sp.]